MTDKEKKFIGVGLKFTGKDVKERDINRLRNLIIKLGIKFVPIWDDWVKEPKVSFIVCDEMSKIKDGDETI